MKRYIGTVSTGLQGSDRQFEFEVEDDATAEEIEAAGREEMFNWIEWSYDLAEPPTEAADAKI